MKLSYKLWENMKKRKTRVKKSVKKIKKSNPFLTIATCSAGVLAVITSFMTFQKSDSFNVEEAFYEEDEECSKDPVVERVITTILEASKEIAQDISISQETSVQIPSISLQMVEADDQKMVNYVPSKEEKELNSSFSLGADYTHVNLKPHGYSSFSGNLWGAKGAYQYRPHNNVYAELNGSWKEGTAHGSAGKRKLLFIDAQERLGYTFATKKVDFLFTLFAGLGYRHLGQKLTTDSNDILKFKYNEIYVPVGFLTNYGFNSWVSIGLEGTWMPQVYPTVKITPLKGSRWILHKTLSNFSVKMPIDFTVTKNKRFHIVLDPFYEHWEDGSSTAETSTGVSLGLPGNNYNYWGGNINFVYCF